MRNQRILKNNVKIIYPELSYEIVGVLYEVHNQLGRFCREKQYCDAIERMLKSKKLEYQREKTIRNLENNLTGNIFDFVIANSIVLEIKAKPVVEKSDYYQLKRYLESMGLQLGILVNFRSKYIKPIRILNSKIHS